jgi:hypothetical protein
MSGGAIVTWADRRNGGVDDIYAQRVDASGNVQWTADGVAICTAMNGQTFPTIASDGNGGAIIAWFDARPDADRNYAQRIDASGVVQWAADGVLVPMPSASSQAVIMGDGLGGAFLAHGSIQRIGPGGSVPTGIGDTPSVSAVALDPNYPNPFSAWTRMNIELAVESEVEVDVFDVAGRKVRELRPGRLGAGAGTIQFDGRDAMGRALPSGVYFYRVTAAGAVTTQKMVIAR